MNLVLFLFLKPNLDQLHLESINFLNQKPLIFNRELLRLLTPLKLIDALHHSALIIGRTSDDLIAKLANLLIHTLDLGMYSRSLVLSLANVHVDAVTLFPLSLHGFDETTNFLIVLVAIHLVFTHLVTISSKNL